MAASCAVPKCVFRHEIGIDVKFHRFPRDEIMRKKWIAATKVEDFQPSATAVMCSRHFKEENYYTNPYGTKLLKKGAIPSVFDVQKSSPKKENLIKATNESEKLRIGKLCDIKSRRICSVPGCGSYCQGNISIHKFPTKIEQKIKWKQVLNIKKPITKYMQVCSQHFKDQDFFPEDARTQRRRLKTGVIPSQNLLIPPKPRKKVERKRNRKYRKLGELSSEISESSSENESPSNHNDHDYTRTACKSVSQDVDSAVETTSENLPSSELEDLVEEYTKSRECEDENSNSDTLVDVNEFRKNHESIIRELTRKNESLLKENSLLRNNISVMDSKNSLLLHKISMLEKGKNTEKDEDKVAPIEENIIFIIEK